MLRIVLLTVFFGPWFLPLAAQLLPPALPQLSLTRYDDSEICDYMYTEALNWAGGPGTTKLALLFDRRGEVAWYMESAGLVTNFDLQPNGMMSFYREGEHILLDSNFQLAGGLGCVGYDDDAHDLIVTPGGRVFLICLEQDFTDLTGATTHDGNSGALQGTLTTAVVQELDLGGNLVREWRARPHYLISDCDSVFFTNAFNLDLNHANSLDWDGRYLLLSQRNNNEVLLLDWDQGTIVWRMGGPHNQFSFQNDVGTRAQHDARFLPGGRISIFDNGTYHNPPRSRGVVYTLDTVAMTVTLDQEYPISPAVSQAMGGFRVLPNGDVLRAAGWALPYGSPNISLLHPNGQVALDIHFPTDYWSYRAQCHTPDWTLDRPRIRCTPEGNGLRLSLDENHLRYLWNTGATSPSILATDTGSYQVFVPKGLGQVGSYTFHVTDMNGSCPLVSSADAVDPRPRTPRLLRRVDLLGREVMHPQAGRVYIEQYSDGSVRKVWQE